MKNEKTFKLAMILSGLILTTGYLLAEGDADAPITPAAESAPAEKAAPAAEKAPAPATKPAKAPKKKKVVKAQKPQKKAGSVATIEQTPAKKQTSLEAWLSKMKKKIAGTETKHNKLVAVASVRGDEQGDVPPLYWKGKSAQGPVTAPELKDFDEAINSAINGDNAIAKSKLDAFVTAYPNSPLKEDAQETLRVLAEGNPIP